MTPFIERSITELIRLFAQLFTTPFAFLSYSERFREQIAALVRDDLKTAHPETVARPLSFFAIWMSLHLLLSAIYWRMVFPGQSLSTAMLARPAETAAKLIESFNNFAMNVGYTGAVIIVAFAMTLIIAVKAYLVSLAGSLLRCRVRFQTALHASAYAFGTFIFFQYVFISVRFLAAKIFPDAGFRLGYAAIAYGTLALSILLVVRVNQVIWQTDGTQKFETCSAWFIGTVAWHFLVILCAIYFLQSDRLSDYWNMYSDFWLTFGQALYPPSWHLLKIQ